MKNELDPNFVVMAQCYARDASDGTLEDTIQRLRAYRDEAGVDWVQFESPHSIDEIRAARAAVTGPFSFMKGKLGRYLDLDEHLALGVTIAWYPGFTHQVTWAALWDFMTAFQSGGVKAWDAFVESRRDRPYPTPEVPEDGESGAKQRRVSDAGRRDLSSRTEGRRPKPPRKEPAGAGWAVCRLWGFDGAAAWVGDALAGVGGGGSATAAKSLGAGELSAYFPTTVYLSSQTIDKS
jgi:hypothetical protein